ncbi:MAG: serine O-acetyltransferase [Alphaproteobacteria bacterium CG11_big_fil_rev_8_21_14_0_20_44_7]|nr:MAG: serine O-acetyltransferase [Alphaproteobacteria bacterium CG11_big_fil_rev_8_21_14_0_20_44_7]
MFERLKSEIKSFQERDPAAKSALDVIFSYPGFHALLFYRLGNWLWRKGFHFLARWVSQISRFLSGIEIHPGANIGNNLFIDHGMGVVIGETATIGDNVTIYHGVTLGGVSAKPGIRHPQIGDNVIIGSGAALLGPINVGHGARIGSNAVVVKDVPAGATMVGVPARNVSKDCAKHKDDEFTAYGVASDELPDIVMRNFEKMEKRLKQLEEELAQTATGWDTKKTSAKRKVKNAANN